MCGSNIFYVYDDGVWGSEKTLAWIIISITKSHKFYELSSYKTFWSFRPFKWLLFLKLSWIMNIIWYLCNVYVFPMLIIRLMNCCLFIFVHTQTTKSSQNHWKIKSWSIYVQHHNIFMFSNKRFTYFLMCDLYID